MHESINNLTIRFLLIIQYKIVILGVSKGDIYEEKEEKGRGGSKAPVVGRENP